MDYLAELAWGPQITASKVGCAHSSCFKPRSPWCYNSNTPLHAEGPETRILDKEQELRSLTWLSLRVVYYFVKMWMEIIIDSPFWLRGKRHNLESIGKVPKCRVCVCVCNRSRGFTVTLNHPFFPNPRQCYPRVLATDYHYNVAES